MGNSFLNIIFLTMKDEEKEELVTISIALDPDVIQKLDEGNYNRSKLIDSLLTKFLSEQETKGKTSDTKK